jgi:hypothetical protein
MGLRRKTVHTGMSRGAFQPPAITRLRHHRENGDLLTPLTAMSLSKTTEWATAA